MLGMFHDMYTYVHTYTYIIYIYIYIYIYTRVIKNLKKIIKRVGIITVLLQKVRKQGTLNILTLRLLKLDPYFWHTISGYSSKPKIGIQLLSIITTSVFLASFLILNFQLF